jgi:hypothetical protein
MTDPRDLSFVLGGTEKAHREIDRQATAWALLRREYHDYRLRQSRFQLETGLARDA